MWWPILVAFAVVSITTVWTVRRTLLLAPLAPPTTPSSRPFTPRLWWRRAAEAPAVLLGLVRQISWLDAEDTAQPLLPTLTPPPAFPLDLGFSERWLLRNQSAPLDLTHPVVALRVQWVYLDVTWADREVRITFEDHYLGARRGDVQWRSDRRSPWQWWTGETFLEERPADLVPFLVELPDRYPVVTPTPLTAENALVFTTTWNLPTTCPTPETLASTWPWTGHITLTNEKEP